MNNYSVIKFYKKHAKLLIKQVNIYCPFNEEHGKGHIKRFRCFQCVSLWREITGNNRVEIWRSEIFETGIPLSGTFFSFLLEIFLR